MNDKNTSTTAEELKRRAATKALEFLRNGMVIGLGTGSTIAHFIELLGQKLSTGELEQILVVPTSVKSAGMAEALGIPVTSLVKVNTVDLAIDGADEVDPRLNLIKGMGGALLREKIIAMHAQRFIVMVDDSKLVDRLGTISPLPVEIIPFESQIHVQWLNTLGLKAELWLNPDGSPKTTDNGNYLALCTPRGSDSPGIPDPYSLAAEIKGRPGIVEHGLFLDLASLVVVATHFGIRILERHT